MSHHIIPSTPAISPLHRGQTEVEPSAPSRNKTAQQPRLQSREAKSRSSVRMSADQSTSQDTVKQHSVPRTLVRIDQKVVDQILIEAKISLEEINSNKNECYEYKMFQVIDTLIENLVDHKTYSETMNKLFEIVDKINPTQTKKMFITHNSMDPVNKAIIEKSIFLDKVLGQHNNPQDSLTVLNQACVDEANKLTWELYQNNQNKK